MSPVRPRRADLARGSPTGLAFASGPAGTEADEQDPRAAPLLAPDLSGLPPALVVVAELDPLRDEGLAFAERLRAAGVPTDSAVYRGAAHGFWWLDGEMRQAGELTDQVARYLRATSA